MKKRSQLTWHVRLVLLLLAAPAAVQAQYDYEMGADDSVTILKYTGPGGDVTIPDTIDSMPVTSIALGAFNSNLSLTSVTIPGSVTNIGSEAFEFCISLRTATILSGNDSQSIGDYAFAFTLLTNVTISTNVTSIGKGAFTGTSLASVTIPNSVTYLGDFAFAFTYLGSVSVPGSVTTIGTDVFEYCTSLTSATMANGVPVIGDYEFAYCTNLTSVTIPDSVINIADYAFQNCTSLTSVMIPASVSSIGIGVFRHCPGLRAITVDAKNQSYFSVNGLLFNFNYYLMTFPGGITGTYTIPTDQHGYPIIINGIGDFAFEDNSGLMVIAGRSQNIYYINSGEAKLPYSYYQGEDGVLFSIFADPNDDPAYADGGIAGLSEYPGGRAGSYVIPDFTAEGFPVTYIRSTAFAYCQGLTSVTIGSGVTAIGEDAFYGCNNLTEITVDPDNPNYTSLGGVLFNKGKTWLIADSSASGTYTIPSSVTDIEYDAFANCSGLTGITIPSSVTSIGEFAFENCTGLAGVLIPGSVASIGFGAFENCASLATVEIADGVTSISDYAFAGCTGLTSVTIPASVTNIGDYAFADCTSLSSVYFYGNAPQIGLAVFNPGAFIDGIPMTPLAPATPPSVTVYHTPTGSGWSSYFGGVSTATWNPVGSLQVTITPAAAISAGAKWQLDGGTIQSSGVTLTNVSAGNHTVSFTPLSGWNLPGPQTVTITNAATTNVTGAYSLASVNYGLVANGGFETGDFSGWRLAGNANGNLVDDGSVTGISPQSGSYDATLGHSGLPSYLSQTLATTAGEDYLLSFWLNPDDSNPNEFLVSWNGTPLLDDTNLPAISDWTNMQFVVHATGTGTLLQFGFQDDNDYLGLDNVSVLPVAVALHYGLVTNGGFETGDFTGWSLEGDGTSTFVDGGLQSGITPQWGGYEAALGQVGSLAYLSQTLSTTAGLNYLLSFWLNSPDGATPNEFLVSWNGTILLDDINLPAISGWTNFQFMVGATGTSTLLQFGAQDDNSYLGLDEISVFPVPLLNIAGISMSGTGLVLNGTNGVAGTTCCVLMSTNLTLPLSQWTPVATNVLVASGNFTVTATNTAAPNVPQKFYILQER